MLEEEPGFSSGKRTFGFPLGQEEEGVVFGLKLEE